ncbi:MAG: hypothetical protein ACXIVG_09840 [Pararhodobacter sp.]
MSFLLRKLLAAKASRLSEAKQSLQKPAEKTCAAAKAKAEQRIEQYENRADHLNDKAASVRDHYQDRADAIRDHYNALADRFSCKGGRLSQKMAEKFSAIGERKAAALEKIGEKKAMCLEKAADKFQAKADCLKKKLHDDTLDDKDLDEDDKDVVDEPDEDGDDIEDGDTTLGTPLPDDAAWVKFYLDTNNPHPEDFEGSNTVISIQLADDNPDFTLEDVYDELLGKLEEFSLELDSVNLVRVLNADFDTIQEYELVDGEFVRIPDPYETFTTGVASDEMPEAGTEEDEEAGAEG